MQPWFSDSHRRRFWLVEGQEDSHFRVYRENDGKTTKTNAWFSVAGTIEEVNALADKFQEEGTLNAKVNAEKLRSVIPRFEQGEEKRRRRDYRQLQKARFARPEPGFSLYEGRTRGKRARYTFDDGEDVFDSDALSTRRSTRQATPSDSGPVITASGRQVKARVGGVYGETLSTDQRREYDYNSGVGEAEGEDSDDEMPATAPTGRPMRSARANPTATNGRDRYNGGDDMDTESDEKQSEGEEWSGDENEPDDEESEGDDSEEDVTDDELAADEGDMQKSLVVRLKYRPKKTPIPPSSRARTPLQTLDNNGNTNGIHAGADGVGNTSTTENKQSQPSISSASPPAPMEIVQPSPQRIVPQGFAAGQQVLKMPVEVMHGIEVPGAPPRSQFDHPTVADNTTGGQYSSPIQPKSEDSAPSTAEASKIQTGTTSPATTKSSYSTLPPTTVPDMSTGVHAPNGISSEGAPKQQYQLQPHVMDVS